MNVIFSIQGNLPSFSTGGPFRIVAQILDEIFNLNLDIKTYLALSNGIFPVMDFPELVKGKAIKFSSTKNFLKTISAIVLNQNAKSKLSFLYKKFLFDFGITHFWKKWRKNDLSPTIIHSHITFGAAPFLKFRNKNSQKILLTYHSKGSILNDYSSEWGRKKTIFTEYLRKREIHEIINADMITFPSLGAFNLMKADYPDTIDDSKVRIIYNGIDCDKINAIIKNRENIKKPNYCLINVAQHVWQKRIDLLIRALAKLQNELPIEILNIGDGPLLKENIELAKTLSVSDNFHFLGRKPYNEVISLISNADAFVMPSENVIFDLITLEAMWIGTPVIVTEDGGNLECIRKNIDGYLIGKGDLPALIRAIKHVLNPSNKIEVSKITQNAKKRIAKDFNSKKMVENYINLYRELSPNSFND